MDSKQLLVSALIYLAGVFFSSCAQIILKKEAVREHDSMIKEYLNPRVILGYGITFGCTLLTVLAYSKGLPVSFGNVLESMGYLFVTIMGMTILGEKVGRRKWMALAVIMVGIFLFAFGR